MTYVTSLSTLYAPTGNWFHSKTDTAKKRKIQKVPQNVTRKMFSHLSAQGFSVLTENLIFRGRPIVDPSQLVTRSVLIQVATCTSMM